eukprot:COSAG01_NODE_19377_length_1013_cov_1.191466_1_plen_67_part_10
MVSFDEQSGDARVTCLSMACYRGESLLRVPWVAVPKELRARRLNVGATQSSDASTAAHGGARRRRPS